MYEIPAKELKPGMYLNGWDRIESVEVFHGRVNFVTRTNDYRGQNPNNMLKVSDNLMLLAGE